MRQPVRLARRKSTTHVDATLFSGETTSPLDLYRTANLLVHQYGTKDALLMAAKRADALLELGDVEGHRVWKGVLRAVEELVRVDRKVGERVN